MFSGVEKRCIGNEWVKVKEKSGKLRQLRGKNCLLLAEAWTPTTVINASLKEWSIIFLKNPKTFYQNYHWINFVKNVHLY